MTDRRKSWNPVFWGYAVAFIGGFLAWGCILLLVALALPPRQYGDAPPIHSSADDPAGIPMSETPP